MKDHEKLPQNKDELINTWAPHQRDSWAWSNETEPICQQMHRTALVALASLREIQYEAHKAKILNAQFGNVAPGYEEYAPE